MSLRKTLSAAAPVALLALFAITLVAIWEVTDRRLADAHAARVQASAEHVSRGLEELVARRLDEMTLLAERIAASGAPTEAEFRATSRKHQERFAGFQALSWVDLDGLIRYAVPFERNAPAQGRDLDEHLTAGPLLRMAERERRLTLTPPIELYQGGWGFATYLPVVRDGEVLGFLNGVFRIRPLLDSVGAGAPQRGLSYLLHGDQDELLSDFGPRIDAGDETRSVSVPVTLAGRQWTVTAIAPASTPSALTGLTVALLLLALGLAGALTAAVIVAARRGRRAEAAAARTLTLIEHSPDAIVVLDVERNRFTEVNGMACELFGLTREELLQTGPVALTPVDQLALLRSVEGPTSYASRALAGEVVRFEWRHRHSSGREIVAEVQLVRLPDESRPTLRGSIVDVTKERELEEQLNTAQRMEAMGKLAGGMAHDFNNLLTGILGAAEMLFMEGSDDEQRRALATEIVKGCTRAGDLTRQLLAFSRSQVVKPIPLELNRVVEQTVPLLERLLGEHVRVAVDLSSEAGPILADLTQLELVVINLAINARDSMPAGGEVTISTSTRSIISARGEQLEAVLTVSDEGEGIPSDQLDRIFEPFFTTKRAGFGTGLGLATVRQVVSQAGGAIAVHSKLGVGTRFELTFPMIDDLIDETDPTSLALNTPATLSPGTGTVALVEDDEAVRAIARAALSRAGYQVAAYHDAESALEAFRGDPDAIDIIVSDVVLPGMRGSDMVAEMRRLRPGLPALLVSGYAGDEVDVSRFRGDAVEALTKPYTPAKLTLEVKRMLERARRAASTV